jgi:Tol biopolymer transport system component
VLAHAVGNGANLRELAWADRKGKRLQTVTKPGSIEGYALAPDEKRVVMSVNDKTQNDFWIQDLIRGTLSRLTFGTQSVTSALWSPDGVRILYGAAPPSSFSYDLFQKAASGGKEDLVAHGGVNAFPSDWSRDGKSIVYSALSEKTNYDLWLLPVETSGSSPAGVSKPVVYLQTPFNETAARFSPDGRFMAYESDESGQYQVYVQTIPASGAKWQISTAGGRQPMWRADGKELYYVADQTLVAVPFRSDAAGFQAGTPESLFDGVLGRDFANAYLPAAGGQRFLVRFAASGDLSAAPPVTVVLNWQTGLKR